jgi:hypothetical protein
LARNRQPGSESTKEKASLRKPRISGCIGTSRCMPIPQNLGLVLPWDIKGRETVIGD